jgi:hypothetical protein
MTSIRPELEQHQSKRQIIKIVKLIGFDTVKFREVVTLALGDEPVLSGRAARIMSNCVEAYPGLVLPHLQRLIDLLEQSRTGRGTGAAVERNIVRLLRYVDIPEKLKARLFSVCIDLTSDPRMPKANRAFAIAVAEKLSAGEPWLRQELREKVKHYLPSAAPSFRARARAILTEE